MSAQPTPGATGIAAPLQQRLSEQLESLSQVGELLTLRLLELEERLEGLEQHVAQLPAAVWDELLKHNLYGLGQPRR